VANERSIRLWLVYVIKQDRDVFVGIGLNKTLAKRFIRWRELTVLDRIFPPSSGKAQDLNAL